MKFGVNRSGDQAHKTLLVVSESPKLFSHFPTLLPYALEQKSRLKLRSVIK
jgi:hypothetical protein